MNSIEMTNPEPTKPDGQNPITEEFSFNSSSKMKLTNHLRRFKWFGAFTLALVMIVTFSTIVHTSKLRNKANLISEMTFNQVQEETSGLVLNARDDELNAFWSREDSESSDDDEEDSGEAAQLKNNGTTTIVKKKSGKRILEVNGSIYKDAWRVLRSKESRFVVLRQNVWNPRLVDAKLGAWASTFIEFKAEFPVAETAIGFIYLGNTGQERFYQVIYIPQSIDDVQAANVITKYGLATDPNVLAKVTGLPVANTIVVRSFRELNALNIMKNAKAGGVVSLWSAEDFESSTAVLAFDGSNYYSVWSTLKSKFGRFAVFRKSSSNQVEIKIGSWSSGINEFKAQFPTNDVAVGFIILDNELIEVVYVPSSKSVKPSKVLTDFYLPANPKNLRSNGLQVPSTIVVKKLGDINTQNLKSNSYQGGIISLWDDALDILESTQVLAADGGNYAAIWNTFKTKTNRFVVFRKSAANPKQIDARVGLWRALVSDFQAEFPVNEEAVGFMLLGSDANPQLYEVVYVPPNKNINAAQVVANFGLPSNPALLRSGLQVADTIVVRNYKDITTTNIVMNSKKAGIISAWDELTSMWWVTSTGSANDGSNYPDVWTTLKEKTKKFVVFRQNAQNSKLIDVEFGDWNTTSADFASVFQVNKPQVGYAYLGTKNHEKLYEVVYVPRGIKTNPATILVNFGLPPNPSKLAQFGLEVPSTYVTTDKKQIDTGNIIKKSTPAGIISLWDDALDILESTQVLAADGGNYAALWNTMKDKTNRFVVFRKNAKNPKQIEARAGLWRALVSDFQAEFPVGEEAVGFIILGGGNYEQLYEVVYIPSTKKLTPAQVVASFGLPTDPKLLKSGLQVADTIVVNSYKDIATTNIVMNSKKAGIISLWDDALDILESTQTLAADGGNYAAVWNTIKAKTNRFVVFKKSAANPKAIDARVGVWNTLVSDFQAEFPVNEEAVGFIVFGSGNNEQLFEVVYIPPNKNLTPAQVLASFGLPTDPKLLRSGLQVADTIVVRNYKDITTTNIIMNSKKAGIISLWDRDISEVVDSTQVLAADGANYAALWDGLKSKVRRFVVFVKNPQNPKQIEAKVGIWNTLVSDFQNQFLADQEGVGFMLLGSDANPQLYEVVYIPPNKNISPAQVVASFGLPSDPKLLKSNGLQVANTIVLRNYNDINTMNMVMKSKQGGIISLWDKEVSEVVESAQVLAFDGANYVQIWNAIKAKAVRFVVFKKNAANPKQIDARAGVWNTMVSDFQAEFPTNEEAVGFIVLGSGTAEQLYEVVFVPSNKNLTPAQVVASFGLPSDPHLLKSGLQVADTVVLKNYKDITSTNIILNSKKAGVISLWDEDVSEVIQSTQVLAADGGNYATLWNTMKDKTNRFVVFRKNAKNPKQIEARAGLWRALVSDFQAEFPVGEEAVGFIILGGGNYEQLYEVVYIPSTKKLTPAQVVASFGLPTDPKLLKSGLQVADTIVVNSYKDIATTNIVMNSKKAGIISAWWHDEEEADDASTAASESELEDQLQSLWWSSSESTTDGSAYSDVWSTLKAKTKRFVIFRQNAENPKLIDAEFGDWNTTSADFASLFQVNKPQVGYAYLGTKYHEKLYEVVYAPTSLKIKPATILTDFGLPLNPNKLTQFGLEVPSVYVANNKKLIDTGNIILKATNNTEISS